MSFICTDNGCINTNTEHSSEDWKQEMLEQGICKEDIELMARFIEEIKNK